MRTKLVIVTALVCVALFHTNRLLGQEINPEQEIRSLEQKFNAAYAANELDVYFSYYAPDMIQWLPEGRTDLPGYKKDWTSYIAAGNRVEAADVLELEVKVSPNRDAVVAAYILRVRTKLANGQVTDEEFQETDVWFKRDGAWKIAALHYSPAPKKKQ
jgi:ketosteroid isomerase-like protein